MKLIRLFLIIIFVGSISSVIHAQTQKEIFLKQIEFKLEKISDIDYENEYFMTIKLNKGSQYVFRVTNHRDNAIGEAVLELMDADNLIMTNLYEDKYYQTVSFQCNKTGFYDVLVKFRDKKIGSSVIDILMLQ
jgi:hypothetical protein